jgi:Kdo2-lipid IVA lauroyltransferase/acyltransferase
VRRPQPLRHRLEEAIAVVASAGVRVLPRRALPGVGHLLGDLWWAVDRRHVAIAAGNLRRAFPDWTEGRVRRTARAVYRHFAGVLLELAWLPGRSREDIMSFVDAAGLEHADRARRAGRGCIYVGAHFGNWEIHAISHAWRGYPVAVLARALDNPRLDARLNGVRRMSGNTVIYKQRALAQVIRSLREDRGVAILVDQNVQEKDGIFVEFFGRPAATTTVAAALAVKTGCALVPVRAVRQADGRYRAICEPALEWTPSGDRAHDIRRLTQQMTTVIEGWIREYPEQWLWMHRRWKTQPGTREGAPAAPAETVNA